MLRTPPRKSIMDARRFGTFRAKVTCSPPILETIDGMLSIEECWLEQMPFVTPFYFPLTMSAYYYVCFTLRKLVGCGIDKKAPIRLESLPPISPHAGVHNNPILLNGNCFYGFALRAEEVELNQWTATYRRVLTQSVAACDQDKHVLTFSWEGKPDQHKVNRLYEVLYWLVALPVYCVLVVPLFALTVILPNRDNKHLNDFICKILAVGFCAMAPIVAHGPEEQKTKIVTFSKNSNKRSSVFSPCPNHGFGF